MDSRVEGFGPFRSFLWEGSFGMWEEDEREKTPERV